MNSFQRFAKTKDGKIHGILSDNGPEETFNLVPQSQWLTSGGLYDAEKVVSEEYPASEVVVTDTNLSIVRNTRTDATNWNCSKF